MKVIITGGTGLIGTALTWSLADDEFEVVVLSRSATKPDGFPASSRVVQWDARTGQGWSEELNDGDAIVNLAGANLSGARWTERQKHRIRESRVNAGNAVVDAIRSSGRSGLRLIQASGISYYGHRQDKLVDESDPPGDDFLARVCIEWERTTEPVEHMGVSRAIIRTAPVLNVNEGALPPILMPFHLYAGGRFGSGDQGFSWIHLDDEVDAIRFLLRHAEIIGPVNLCAPNPVSNRELAAAISKVMHRPARVPVPSFALRAMLGEVADTVLLGQYAIPRRLADAGFSFQFPYIEEALADLLAAESGRPGSPLFRRGVSSAVRLFLP